MKSVLLVTCLVFNVLLLQAQKPKLVVGIVVDQMRTDYLIRYKNHFSENGFNRFLQQGTWCKNVHYNYTPTYTGPGHASIYTGTTPLHHGIIANDWHDRKLNESVYCVQDDSVNSVGTTSKYGKMAPTRLLATTITDQLRIQSQFRSKVVGVAIKDRGSILPAGHNPNGAYWYDKSTGHFITSDYYTQELPKWAKAYNRKNRADELLSETWDFLLQENQYTESEGDAQPYEMVFKGNENSSFPYNLKELRENNGNFGLLPSTPFGNTLTTEFAMAAIEGEELGKDNHLDFLALSYSSPDYIGHAFGPQSKEVEDCYIRLDRELEQLFEFLDKTVGKDEYVVFLTADHSAAEPVGFMQKHQMPAGFYHGKTIINKVNTALLAQFETEELIQSFSNDQIFLNHEKMNQLGIDREELENTIVQSIESNDGVVKVFTQAELLHTATNDRIIQSLQRGIHLRRSGDLIVLFESGWMHQLRYATTHGTGYTYDTHVPLLWVGQGVRHQQIYTPYAITDIAYTLAMMFDVTLPSAAVGKPILQLLD